MKRTLLYNDVVSQDINFVNKVIWTENSISTLNSILADQKYVLREKNLYKLHKIIIVDKSLESVFVKNFKKIDKSTIIIRNAGEPDIYEVDACVQKISNDFSVENSCVISIGGGSTLDFGKAVSNLLGNPGLAETYQGWELVENPGAIKIGIPTIFGTGAETSRTCVLLNPKRKLKLGMNSVHSLFDLVIINPEMANSAPREVIFFTAMDGLFHATEILRGKNRSIFTDSIAKWSQERMFSGLVKFVEQNHSDFLLDFAVGSFFGGIALANGTVGLVHPFSAALSVVFGTPHGKANCLAFKGLAQFYPEDSLQIESLISKFTNNNQSNFIRIDSRIIRDRIEDLVDSTLIHEKPLSNHLGANYKEILTRDRIAEIFLSI